MSRFTRTLLIAVATGVSAGTATITVSGTFNGETYSDSLSVEVYDPSEEWDIDWDDIWDIFF